MEYGIFTFSLDMARIKKESGRGRTRPEYLNFQTQDTFLLFHQNNALFQSSATAIRCKISCKRQSILHICLGVSNVQCQMSNIKYYSRYWFIWTLQWMVSGSTNITTHVKFQKYYSKCQILKITENIEYKILQQIFNHLYNTMNGAWECVH